MIVEVILFFSFNVSLSMSSMCKYSFTHRLQLHCIWYCGYISEQRSYNSFSYGTFVLVGKADKQVKRSRSNKCLYIQINMLKKVIVLKLFSHMLSDKANFKFLWLLEALKFSMQFLFLFNKYESKSCCKCPFLENTCLNFSLNFWCFWF